MHRRHPNATAAEIKAAILGERDTDRIAGGPQHVTGGRLNVGGF